MKSVVAFAQEVLDMDDEIQYLRSEVARLKKYEDMYGELLNDSVRHGEQMIGGMLALILKPGVSEALMKNAE